MNKRKKWSEHIKTALIILLSCSAVYLLSLSGLVSSATLQSLRPGSTDVHETVTSHRGSTPLVISVNLGDGQRYGVKYDAQALGGLYSGFSAVLGEALGSAGEPTAVSSRQWQQALNEKSIYLDFLYPQPLTNLASGLGVQMSSAAAQSWAARLCLAPADGMLLLYYCSGGEYFSCATALRPESLNISGELVSNGAAFAWENGAGNGDADFLILRDMPEIPALNVTNTVSAAMEDDGLLTLAEMNAVIASRYPESDGSSVYVEGERTLRVSLNGTVTYRYYVPEEELGSSGNVAPAIEAAWNFAESTVGAHCGAAELHLADAFFDEGEQAWCVEFLYVVNGLPVELSRDGRAARVYVRGETVVSAELTFRSFTSGDGLLVPLPEKQAVAALQAEGATAHLAYFEGAEAYTAAWKKTGEVG